MFEWQEQYRTSERSERVRYCSCHENIKFISSSQHVMFFLYYGDYYSKQEKGREEPIQRKQKTGIVTSLNGYDTHKGDIRKIRHLGPG